MTDRIKRMQAALKTDKFVFCAEKPKLVIESWKKHEGLPSILRRAHATADYLDNRTIYVDEDELIVGNVASKPHGLEASCWGPFWDDDDLDSILEGNYTISDEDRATLRSLDSFWEGEDRQRAASTMMSTCGPSSAPASFAPPGPARSRAAAPAAPASAGAWASA